MLLADGDGLAYYCAGNDDTPIGQAKQNLLDKLRSAARVVGAGRTVVLLTLSGSDKGGRYAIARVKPYQGQRVNSRRPRNWQGLRDTLLDWQSAPPSGITVEATATAEADDLFGWWCYNYPDDAVVYTQDKDMRMLPGLHLDWVSHISHRVGYQLTTLRDKYRAYNVLPENSEHNEKQYGPKWFWLQMLHGDAADHIPGLPRYVVDGKAKLCGEVTANKLLDTNGHPAATVAWWYKSYYNDRWLVEMLEQACLLWMRRDPEAWDDCVQPGGPLACFDHLPEFLPAYAEIEQRVNTARIYNTATEDHPG